MKKPTQKTMADCSLNHRYFFDDEHDGHVCSKCFEESIYSKKLIG